jgi:outer membrane protein TolC
MNWRKKIVAAAMTACVLLMTVWPEENVRTTKSLSADEAVRMALKTHVDLQRSSISLNQAARKFHHAWNSFLPALSAAGTGNELSYYSNQTSDSVTLTAGVTASLSLDAGLGSNIAKLKSEYEAGILNYNDTVRDVEYTVRESYYGLLYSKENLSVSQKSLSSYQQQYDQTLQKRNKGVVPELDLLSAQVNLETAKTDLQSARSDYENNLLEFLTTIGMEYDSTIELTGSLDYAEKAAVADPAAVLNDCVERSSDVQTLENNIKTATYTRNQTFSSSFLPAVSVNGTFYPADYTYEKKSDTEAHTPYWSVSIGISLPVDSWIPGSSANDTVADLNDTIKDYELQLADKKKNVRTDIIEKLQKIDQAASTLKARQLNVELAEKSYEMTEKAYQSGTKDLLTLQSAIDTYHSAQLQLSSEQYTLICDVFDLEKALGLSSDTFFTNMTTKEEVK